MEEKILKFFKKKSCVFFLTHISKKVSKSLKKSRFFSFLAFFAQKRQNKQNVRIYSSAMTKGKGKEKEKKKEKE